MIFNKHIIIMFKERVYSKSRAYISFMVSWSKIYQTGLWSTLFNREERYLLNFVSPNIQYIKDRINKDLIPQDIERIHSAREKSKMIMSYDEYSASCSEYYNGNYMPNGRLCKKEKLSDDDITLLSNMHKTLGVVEPLDYPVVLIHGFESHLEYDTKNWGIGKRYYFPFFLSKTVSWQVATYFAKASGNRFYQKYLLCCYDKGSRHICLDIKDEYNDEYEYLSGFEKFEFVEKIYHLSLFPYPVLRVYYVMKHIDTILEVDFS